MGEWLELTGLRPLDDPPGEELEAFERSAVELEEAGVALPRWILWDLGRVASAGATRAGSRFEETRNGRAWREWLRRTWRPLFAASGVPGLGPLGLLQVATVISAWRDEGHAEVRDGGWDWAGAEDLLDAARRGVDPRRFLGATSFYRCTGATPLADPFLQADLPNRGRTRGPARLQGSFSTARSDSIQHGPSGSFHRRLPGPIPDNAARIDPFDLMLARDVPELFLLRVAERAIGQRYFKVPRLSDSVPRVLLSITVVDSVDAHRFDAHSGSVSSREKLVGVELARAVAGVAFPKARDSRGAVDLQLRFQFEPALRGFPKEAVRVPAAVQRSWVHADSRGVVDWLTERLPAFGSRAPVRIGRRSPHGAELRGEHDLVGWDRQISVRIGGRGGGFVSFPTEGRWDLALEVGARVEGGWIVSRPGVGAVGQWVEAEDLVEALVQMMFMPRGGGGDGGGDATVPVVELAP